MTQVLITTAIPVSASQKVEMEKSLSAKFKADQLHFEYKTDETVIGGVKVMIGSREFDATLKNKLTQLHESLTAKF